MLIYKYLKVLGKLLGSVILLSYLLIICLNMKSWYHNDGQQYIVYDTDFHTCTQEISAFVRSNAAFSTFHEPAHGRILFLRPPCYVSFSNDKESSNYYLFENYIPELDGVLEFEMIEEGKRIYVKLKSFVPSYETRGEKETLRINDSESISLKENFRIMSYFENNILNKYTGNYKKNLFKGYICNYYLSFFYKFHLSIWIVFLSDLLLTALLRVKYHKLR